MPRTPGTAPTCGPPFASKDCGCDDSARSLGSEGYCTPGNYSPLPRADGDTSPSASSGPPPGTLGGSGLGVVHTCRVADYSVAPPK